jgi:tetratricopeptide (TPR) repeat protein
LLDCYGRTDEALTQLEIAQRLAPSKVIIYRAFGNTYYVARDYTNAIAWYQKAIQWEPHHYVAYGGIGRCFQAMGNYTNALEYFEQYELLAENDKPATKKRFILLRQALARDGIQGCWTQYRMWVDNDPNASLYWKAQIQIYLGHTNAALNLLQTSYDKHERSDDYQTPLNQLLYDDCWDGLHDNRQFKLLLDRIGFTKVMRRKQ